MKNKAYKIELEILTPIHIGNGNTISGINYFCYQKQLREGDEKHKGDTNKKKVQVYKSYLYRYNIKDLINILENEDKKELKEKIEKGNVIEFRNKIWYLLKDIETEEYKNWVKNREYENWLKTYENIYDYGENLEGFKEFKKNDEYKKWKKSEKYEKFNKNYKEYKKIRYEHSKYYEKFLEIAEKLIDISNKFFQDFIQKMSQKGKQIKGKNEKKQKNEGKNQISQLIIQEQIRGLNGYYIPGSSLKGAIRTVLSNNEIEKISPKNDSFKKLIVRDSEQKEDIIEIGPLARKSKKAKDDDGEINGDGNFAEFIKSGEKLNTEIIIKSFLQEPINGEIITKEQIISRSKKYYTTKLKKYITELDSFKIQIKNSKIDKIRNNTEKIKKINNSIKSFENILDNIEKLGNNECILNIGFGGGFWFKSFEGTKNKVKFDDYYRKNGINTDIAKTIYTTKLSNNQALENLGYIKLTFTD